MTDTSTPRCTLVDVWHLNNRVNLRLLDALSDEQLGAVVLPRGRAVTSYFVHIHMARYYWLQRRAPALTKGFRKIPGGAAPRAAVRQALIDSGNAMAELFTEAERTGVMKGVKQGPLGFLAYALTHEAHHRGQVLLHLKIARLPLNRKTADSLWYWNKI
jgi:uncharacterized damage-inducible protein DinB